MMASNDLMDLEDWVADSNQALCINIISSTASSDSHSKAAGKRAATSWSKPATFHPLFSYTVFGDEEKIFGYKNLKINLNYSPASLYCYLGLEYTERIKSKKVHAQDIIGMMMPHLPEEDVTFDLDLFNRELQADKSFKPIGEKVYEYKLPKDKDSVYEIYKCDFGVKRFQQFHRRLQTFLVWYIEGARFLDDEDERWQFVVIWKKSGLHQSSPFYEIVGYSSFYPFFHYPEQIRMRISQILILPHCQKMGHGSKLYSYMYETFSSDSKVFDITVEDPNDLFQEVRDRCDVSMLIDAGALEGVSPAQMTATHMKDLQLKFKICERQATRCAELILLKRTSKWDASAFRQYRLFVKKRLYKKNKEVLAEMELGDRIQALQHTFDAIEEDYQQLLSKI